MTIRSKLTWLFLSLFLALALPLAARAQSESTIYLQVDNSVPIWDLSGSYNLTATLDGAGGAPVPVSLTVDLTTDGRGHWSGQGTNFFAVGSEVLYGSYTASGKITNARGVTQASLTVRAKGIATVAGRSTKFRITAVYSDLEADPETGNLYGTARAKASFSGQGSARGSHDVTIPLPAGMDGTWTLAVSIFPLKPITGTATVTLSNGRVLPFMVNGNYSQKFGADKLKLKGTDAAKGSKLQVLTDEVSILNVDGKVLGQNVQY